MNRTPRGRRPWVLARPLGLAGALVAAVLGCSDETIGPEAQPFGRIGDVRIQVVSPILDGAGQLDHRVEWSSDGPWRSVERISYRDRLGDETVLRSTGDVISLARTYAAWIDLVNDTPSVSLFSVQVDPALRPSCDPPMARVSLTIVDRTRGDSISWTRCSDRSLPTLSGAGAGPDPNASRVVQAAALVRSFTLDQQKGFRYQYTGSMPFATVERGEAAFPFTVPRVIENDEHWRSFWAELTGAASSVPPAVNFTTDVVLVGVVGTRDEAGDSVEIRGVLPVAGGTQIALWERRAGHFCTPARRMHVPYHAVVAPREGLQARPIFFSDVSLDTVPCG
jgi:hypothetical protein